MTAALFVAPALKQVLVLGGGLTVISQYQVTMISSCCVFSQGSLLMLFSLLTNVHFFSFPAPATAGGYAAVGLSAATLTDAAVATAAPPDFAASRAANNPAWPAYSAFAAPCTR